MRIQLFLPLVSPPLSLSLLLCLCLSSSVSVSPSFSLAVITGVPRAVAITGPDCGWRYHLTQRGGRGGQTGLHSREPESGWEVFHYPTGNVSHDVTSYISMFSLPVSFVETCAAEVYIYMYSYNNSVVIGIITVCIYIGHDNYGIYIDVNTSPICRSCQQTVSLLRDQYNLTEVIT